MFWSVEIVIKLLQVVCKLSTFAVNIAKLWSSNIDLVSSPARVISFKYQQHGWLAWLTGFERDNYNYNDLADLDDFEGPFNAELLVAW